MLNQNQLRSYLLATTSILVCFTTAYSLIEPTAGNRSVSSFTFPDNVSLNSWQLLSTKTLDRQQNKVEQQSLIKSGKRYSFDKGDMFLQIEMRYIVRTRGNVRDMLAIQNTIPQEAYLKAFEINAWSKLPGVGFHTLFTYQNQAYLSSCINPHGSSTVTQTQFTKNLNAQVFQPSLVFAWLLGKASIRDRRCLWTLISMPINQTESEKAYQILEKAWQDWYWWWQPRFPSL